MDSRSILDGGFDSGRNAWPEVKLARATFDAYVRERAAPGADIPAQIARDLYLACACVGGDPAALRALEHDYLARLPGSLGRVDTSPAFADEAIQVLREKLLVGPGGRGGKLLDYSGRGPLLAWLRAAVIRTALNLKAASPRSGASEESDAQEIPARANDPELDFLKTRYQAEFNAAFGAVLGALPAREKNVLRLYLLERKNVAAIGAIYQVDRTTVTRWIVRARKSLLDGTRARLIEKLGVGAHEAASLMRLLESRIDVSISRVLREGS